MRFCSEEVFFVLDMCAKMRCTSLSYLYWTVIVIILLLGNVPYSDSVKLLNIHWNTSNPIFRIDNTDNIMDVNRGNLPFEYDQVNIVCPVYTPGTHEDDAEKYIIYNVSKEEYDTCRIMNPTPRIIAICNKPYRMMYFTITFRPFTPQPGGLEFLPGNDYYFISTSSKDDLHRRIGGRCDSHNMKVVFKVCCKDVEKPKPNYQRPGPGMLLPRRTTTSTTTTTTTARTTTTTTTPSTTTHRATSFNKSPDLLPGVMVPGHVPNNNNNNKPPKKSGEFSGSKHPNAIVNEELTGSSSPGATTNLLVTLLCVTVAVMVR